MNPDQVFEADINRVVIYVDQRLLTDHLGSKISTVKIGGEFSDLDSNGTRRRTGKKRLEPFCEEPDHQRSTFC
ncbi:hypothetical protein ACJIZ3_006229 [Penstemon smallii]|uniref:Uncharacterized protein n=1 Tax=Penstemon smallii TaxID=265156 RepID=A0ABD3S729_9LAMI